MKIILFIPILLFSILLSISSYPADFEKGFTAYENKDYATALKEWKPLAEQGYSSISSTFAQFNLGLMYQIGQGVPQDSKEAVRLWRLAAEQGHVSAQNILGVMYAFGEGVIQDKVYAHMWLNIAASTGDDGSKEYKNKVEKLMTASQIEEAQRLARECVKKNYIGC